MEEGLIVRRFSGSDSYEQLTGLLHRAYARLGERGWNATASYQSVEVTRERAEEGACFVAEIEGTVVGTATVVTAGSHPGPDLYAQPHVAMLGQFGIEPSHRGQGVGRALMKACEDEAMRQGRSHIACDTVAANEELVAYYRANGFQPVGHHQWPGKTYLSVVLLKPLDGSGE
ncbi:MAG: GNAT family N-acetyltransferase [Armatimonadetes bacterium]|nr:GNAT family N-acetyltransferase [Armatimonadota bacterium]